MLDQLYEDLSNFRGIELESEIERLNRELMEKDDKIAVLYNESIDHFSRWSRGVTFEQWQVQQKKDQESGKRVKALKRRMERHESGPNSEV